MKIGPRLWKLTEPLIFYSEVYKGYVEAPEGTVTNFASIPRFLWVLFPPVDVYDYAAVIHDAAYHNDLQTIMGTKIFTIKKVADDLFLEGLLAMQMDPDKAAAMYRLVKKFGKPYGHPLSS